MKDHEKRTGNYDHFPFDSATANVGKIKPLTNTEWLQQDLYLKAGLPVEQNHSAIKIGRMTLVNDIVELLEDSAAKEVENHLLSRLLSVTSLSESSTKQEKQVKV